MEGTIMKGFERFMSLVMAGIIMASASVTAFAEEEEAVEAAEETEAVEVTDKYVTDPSLVTDSHDTPSLSFDTGKWENYVEAVGGAGISFTLSNDNTSAFQGQCLRITADAENAADDNTFAYNWSCLSNKGEPLFEAEPDAEKDYTMAGVLLKAEKFGLECFNGSTVALKYRIGEDYKKKLMADSIFLAPVDKDNHFIPDAKVTRLEVNTTDNNNVTSYATGLVSVADLNDTNTVPAAGVIIMIPVHAKAEGLDILDIDNLTVTLKSGAQIGDLDGYNKNAKQQDGVIEVNRKVQTNDVKISKDDVPLKSKIKTIFVIVGLSVLGIAVVTFIIVSIVKAKKRFY